MDNRSRHLLSHIRAKKRSLLLSSNSSEGEVEQGTQVGSGGPSASTDWKGRNQNIRDLSQVLLQACREVGYTEQGV